MTAITMICGQCHAIKPLLGSCGGGPSGTKRTCADCRYQFPDSVRETIAVMRARPKPMSYRKLADHLRTILWPKPAPSAWLIEKWCKELK